MDKEKFKNGTKKALKMFPEFHKELSKQLQNPNLAVGDIITVNLSTGFQASYAVTEIQENKILLSTANELEMWVPIKILEAM